MSSNMRKKIGLQEIRAFTETAADLLICCYLLLMLAVFPLYSQEGYAHIGTDKAYFFCRVNIWVGYVLAVLLGIRIAAKGAALLSRKRREGRRIAENLSSTDVLALLYGGAVLISYGCSRYRGAALWGARGWYMGLIPQLMLVAIYFAVSRLWRPRRWMLLPMLAVSAGVFLLGCLNRFGIYPIEMQYSSPSYISTIGNINWFCGYAVTTGFFGAVLLWLAEELKPAQRAFLSFHAAAGFLALVLQGSDSGLAALAIVFLVMFLLSAEDERRMAVFWREAVLLADGCLLIFLVRLAAPDRMNYTEGLNDLLTYGWLPVIMTIVSAAVLALVEACRRRGRYPKKVFRMAAVTAVCGFLAAIAVMAVLAVVNTVRPGSIGVLSEYRWFTLDEGWGSSRGSTLAAGWRCFAEQDLLHKLTGVGPDCMSEYIYSGAGSKLLEAVTKRFGSLRLTNAHNEWLTVLVNTGLLGAASFAGLMVSGIRRLLQGGRKNPPAAACGFCLLAYTVNNVFSFQQAMSVGTVFVIFGMGTAFLRAEEAGGSSS